jgi:uncharacterized protein
LHYDYPEAGAMKLYEKLNILRDYIRALGSVAVAFSGGVDSAFLLKVAYEVLADKAIAVTARSSTFPQREYKEATDFAEKLGVRHITIDSEELDIEGFSQNPANRCYFCKHELFSKILEVAIKEGIEYIADGSNTDDLGDYRPGLKAVNELKVVSPLKESLMTKEDIRLLSREMNLATWNKPAFACLASRFPYGQEITAEKLKMVDHAEQYLLDLGFRQVRVRHHGDIARIEVSADERAKFFDLKTMDNISDRFKEIGFIYVSLDLKGYRTGSMNETLVLKEE